MQAILLILAVVIFRVVAGTSDDSTLKLIANFSPLAALALCGGAFFRGVWAWALPLVAVVVSDVVLNLLLKNPVMNPFSLSIYASLVAVVAIGWAVRRSVTIPRLLSASIAGSLLFYLVTNTVSFFCFPGYEPSFAGWVQSLTMGLPGFPPTYVFFLKSLVGDLIFTATVALACGVKWSSRRQILQPVPVIS
jgi:hypothetical protein